MILARMGSMFSAVTLDTPPSRSTYERRYGITDHAHTLHQVIAMLVLLNQDYTELRITCCDVVEDDPNVDLALFSTVDLHQDPA